MESVTGERKRILEHMLGVDGNPRRVWGYRNYYAVRRSDGFGLSRLRGMETDGLVCQGMMAGSTLYFHATEAGCRTVGLNTIQTRRALEGWKAETKDW